MTTHEMKGNIQRRLALIGRGFRPIPINGKRPYLSDWPNIKADAAAVQSWEFERPRDTNTGILTKDVPVIDIDIRDQAAVDKIEALVRSIFSGKGKLLKRTGMAPKCAFPFRTDEPFEKLQVGLWGPEEPKPKELADCKHRIEILGSGQQVVVDCIHPDTNLPYQWTGGEPWTVGRDELPLLTYSDARAFVAEAKEALTSLGWGVFETEDKRDDVGDPNTKGHSSLIVELAIRLWGEPSSRVERELRFGSHGSKAVDLKTGMWFDFENNVGGGLRDLMQTASAVGRPDSSKSPPEVHYHGTATDKAKVSWSIKNLMYETGVGLLSGQWGTAKTLVALEIAGSLLPGVNQEHFIDYRIKRKGGVLFIAAEGSGSIRLRFEAMLAKKLGLSILDQDNPAQPFAWINFQPQLLKRGAKELIAIAEQAAASMKEKFGVDLVLVVIDTVAAAAAFQREDDAAQGQTVMDAFRELSTATGTFVLGVDHFGKDVDTGTRGTSAKESAADMVLALIGKREVTGRMTDLRMGVRKVKDADQGRVIPFRLEVIDCGTDEDGDSITSCLVHWELDRKVGQAGRHPKGHALILQAIRMSLIRESKTFEVDGVSVRAATRDAVRDKFKDLVKEKEEKLTDNAVKLRWKRELKKSIEDKVVGVMRMEEQEYLFEIQQPF